MKDQYSPFAALAAPAPAAALWRGRAVVNARSAAGAHTSLFLAARDSLPHRALGAARGEHPTLLPPSRGAVLTIDMACACDSIKIPSAPDADRWLPGAYACELALFMDEDGWIARLRLEMGAVSLLSASPAEDPDGEDDPEHWAATRQAFAQRAAFAQCCDAARAESPASPPRL